jgi:hypothetical protein
MINKNNIFASIPYLRAFKIKYISCTNTKDARIKIIDMHRSHEKTISKTINYDYELSSNSWETATLYLNKIGIKVLFRCSCKNYEYLLTDNFEVDLK